MSTRGEPRAVGKLAPILCRSPSTVVLVPPERRRHHTHTQAASHAQVHRLASKPLSPPSSYGQQPAMASALITANRKGRHHDPRCLRAVGDMAGHAGHAAVGALDWLLVAVLEVCGGLQGTDQRPSSASVCAELLKVGKSGAVHPSGVDPVHLSHGWAEGGCGVAHSSR